MKRTTGAGQKAALPALGWRSADRRDGCVVFFVSEDGTQRVRFDFSSLPVQHQVKEQLAEVLTVASGPAGTWKRAATARNFVTGAKAISDWIAQTHPDIGSLEELRRADARLMARSFTSARQLDSVRSIVRNSQHLREEFKEEFCRYRLRREDEPEQPYDAHELDRISIVARALVRRCRDRIWAHRELVSRYREGDRDGLGKDQLLLAEALDHCSREHDMPRDAETNRPTMLARRAVQVAGGVTLMSLLHPSPKEVWAFGVLLAAQTGLNKSVLEELRAPSALASAPNGPQYAVVDVYKPRRGRRSRGTMALSTYPPELAAAPSAPGSLQATSLNAPFGVFSLLIDLTGPARTAIHSNRAFVCYAKGATTEGRFREGMPGSDRRRELWVEPWLTGAGSDEAVKQINFQRLRRTRILQTRRPIDHTEGTYTQYIRGMRPAVEDGFAVVREALDSEVRKALARREMAIVVNPSPRDDAGPDNDTIVANCSNFAHSPLDGDEACRRTFLACLDCRNARALPRHLTLQLLVTERLAALRCEMTAQEWVSRHAGQHAQLEEVVSAYTPAQREQARAAATAEHCTIVDQLFAGTLDAAT